MKKLILAALVAPAIALAQSYPSPKFNSITLQTPLTAANGGTGATASTGTGSAVLSSSAALTTPTIASPVVTGAFTATGLVTTADLAAAAANTVLANVTGSSASPSAFAMPSCSTSTSALQWTSGTGFTCITTSATTTGTLAQFAATTSAQLAGIVSDETGTGSLVFGTSPTINTPAVSGGTINNASVGASTPSTGAFTTLSASGTVSGAGFTSLVAKSLPCPSILSYGGDNTNTNANDTAFASALAAGPSGNACVYFPAGTYKFASLDTYTLPTSTASVTILGAGQDVTNLVWPSGQGMKLNLIAQYNSFHIRDMSLLTGTTNAGPGIFINQTASSIPDPANTPLSDITNVTLRGSDGYAITDYWSTAINVYQASNINFNGTAIMGSSSGQGIGIDVSGTLAVIPVQYNLVSDTFYNLLYGFVYGNYVQGVSVNQSNFTYGGYGIYVPAGETDLDQLTVTGSQFNNTAIDIDELTNIPSSQFSANLFLVQNNAFGINIAGAGLYEISGNSFWPESTTPSANTGIDLSASTAPGTITGNTFYKMMGSAIFLASTSSNVNILGNSYASNGANVSNSGTNNTVEFSTPPAIGNLSPNSGNFTTLGATGAITPSSTAGIVGTTAANNANAGSFGEFMSAAPGSSALTTGAAANLASVNLTAGDWDVSGSCQFAPAGSTTISVIACGISTTSGSLGTIPNITYLGGSFIQGSGQYINTPTVRINISAATTVYVIGQSSFGASTMSAAGFLRARRVR